MTQRTVDRLVLALLIAVLASGCWLWWLLIFHPCTFLWIVAVSWTSAFVVGVTLPICRATVRRRAAEPLIPTATARRKP